MRQVTTLRTAAQGLARREAPIESAPYGPSRIDPSLLRHIPILTTFVMLGEERSEEGLG